MWMLDPDARLDYSWDWKTKWLRLGDSISSATFSSVPDGLVFESQAIVDGVVSVMISGCENGKTYNVTCHGVSEAGREDDWTKKIRCCEK